MVKSCGYESLHVCLFMEMPLSYELWKQIIELWKSLIQTTSKYSNTKISNDFIENIFWRYYVLKFFFFVFLFLVINQFSLLISALSATPILQLHSICFGIYFKTSQHIYKEPCYKDENITFQLQNCLLYLSAITKECRWPLFFFFKEY